MAHNAKKQTQREDLYKLGLTTLQLLALQTRRQQLVVSGQKKNGVRWKIVRKKGIKETHEGIYLLVYLSRATRPCQILGL